MVVVTRSCVSFPPIQTNALPIDYGLPLPIPFVVRLLALCVLEPQGPCPGPTRAQGQTDRLLRR